MLLKIEALFLESVWKIGESSMSEHGIAYDCLKLPLVFLMNLCLVISYENLILAGHMPSVCAENFESA